MTNEIDRRTFLARSAAAGIGIGVLGDVSSLDRLTSRQEGLTVAVMGVNSRGGELAR